MFDCLLDINSDKIKDLSFDDITKNLSFDDNFLNLIKDYEKIKCFFKNGEIIKLWKEYINLYIKKDNIKELIKIKNALSNYGQTYKSIIDEINIDIKNLGKKLIIRKNLKGKEMYIFINEYNYICEFYTEDEMLVKIAENIDLNELSKDQNSLIEFKKCKFFDKLDYNKIDFFFINIIKQIIRLEDFYVFLKNIYPLSQIRYFSKKDNSSITKELIIHFIKILDKYSNEKILFIEENEIIIQTLILLEVINLEKVNDNNLISTLWNSCAFDRDNLIKFLIKKIINYNIDEYVSFEKRKLVYEIFLKKFFKLNIEKIVFFLPEFESIEFKEKNIYNKFPMIKFEDILNIDDTNSLIYFQNLVKNKIIEKDKNTHYFKNLFLICDEIIKKLKSCQINFDNLENLNNLINQRKLAFRINCLFLGDESKSIELEKQIEGYVIKYKNSQNVIQNHRCCLII